jgi:N-acetylglutamate synthase-like GNAT family acetyltransferase
MEIRPATLDDVDRLAAFMGRCTLAHQGLRRASADEMRQRLTKPGTDPALDAWLVEDDGEVAGFAQVWRDEPAIVCYVRVDPEQTGRGIGSTLLERGSARALELGQRPFTRPAGRMTSSRRRCWKAPASRRSATCR